MTGTFADTYYFLALLDSREKSHPKAVDASRDRHLNLVTTEWVLAEFGDAYCHPRDGLTSWRCIMLSPINRE